MMGLKQKSRSMLIAAAMILLVCLSAGAVAGEPVRIMPLGDSITRGSGSTNYNGYRKPLYLKLISRGYDVDFVGGQNDGDFADRNHEGHSSWHAAGGTGGGEFVNDVSILWFADSHYCDREPDGRYYRQVLTHKLPAAINRALIDNCDFVACSGDFSEFEYNDGEETLDNLSALLSAVEAYMPCAVAVGNHDIPYATKPGWISRYDRDFDRDNSRAYFSFSVKGRHFVFLDAMFNANSSNYGGVWNDTYEYYIPTAEQIWLENDLAAHSNERTFVFTHQRIDLNDYLVGGAHACVNNTDSAAVRAILEAAGNVEAVFQGHVHKSAYSLVNGIHYYTIMGMVDGDCEANPNNNAYAIINITENGVFTITPYRNADNQNSWDIKTFQLGGNVGLLPNVYNWLVANPADIVLLHIGTNDITYAGQNVDEVSGILDEIDRFSEDITVILALIINRQSYSSTTAQFNDDLNSMALNRIANGDDIVIVDMESALNYSTDMADNLHPNDAGYAKIADVWFNALDSILAVPPVIVSAPVRDGIVTQPYIYDVDADGYPDPNYTLVTRPDGMTIDPNTGRIEWVPAAAGDFEVTVEASNGRIPDANQSFTVVVSTAIKFDAVSSDSNSTAGPTLSWPHTIGSGNDRMLVVGAAAEDDSVADLVISSVTYNGINMNPVEGSTSTAGTTALQKTELYYLFEDDLPPAGTYNVVVTYSGNVGYKCAGAVSLENVEQQLPEAVAANASENANTISTDIITLTNGAWVVDMVGCGSRGSFCPIVSGGMVERFDLQSDSSTAAGGTKLVISAEQTTIGWNFSGSSSAIAHSLAAFAPTKPVISGYVLGPDYTPVVGVLVSSADPNVVSDTTDPNGYYKVSAPYGWSGLVEATKTGYVFKPSERTYGNVIAKKYEQDYEDITVYDLDNDGFIGWGDVAVISENWLKNGPGIKGDLHNDGVVNFLDFVEFTLVW